MRAVGAAWGPKGGSLSRADSLDLSNDCQGQPQLRATIASIFGVAMTQREKRNKLPGTELGLR